MMFYEKVLKAFNREGVEFVVIGGIALNLHGVPRATADLDMAIALEEENLKKIVNILKAFGHKPRAPINIDEFAIGNLERWRNEKKMDTFTFWNPKKPYEEIDILIHNPIDFGQLKSKAQIITAEGLEIPIASIDHLIKLKRISNREQDKSDIKALQKIEKLREK